MSNDWGRRTGHHLQIIARTILQNTNYPLCTWFQLIFLVTQSKNGISASQIHRQIGGSNHRTVW